MLLVLLLVSLSIGYLPVINCSKDTPQCDGIYDTSRFDCIPEGNASQIECMNRGCCWSIPTIERRAPYCFFPKNFPNYHVINEKLINEAGASYNIQKNQSTYRPNEILKLSVDVIYHTQNTLRVKIYDPITPRYEVPLDIGRDTKVSDDTNYYVTVVNDPFAIKVYRKSNQALL